MRVLLISPDRKDVVAARAAGERRIKAAFPPLSLLQVAALTPPDVEVELADEAVADLDLTADADLVGITAFTSSAPRAYEVASAFRSRGIPVVLGGMHASACPDEALQYCDAVVVGEAEGTWPALVEDVRRGRLQSIYRNGEYPDLTNSPGPRRDLIRSEDYVLPGTVQATRGCAHGCSFCSVSTFFGRAIRSRSAEAVSREIESLPGRFMIFVDDNIMTRPQYARDLFERIRGLGKPWMGQASTPVLQNTELVRLAARAGCKGLLIGLETTSKAALDRVNKSFNVVERFKELVARLHDVGIGVIGSFMFGFDDDDDSVFERTAAFVDEAEIDLPQYSILTPLPGTPLYTQLDSEGRIFDRDWSHYDGGHVVYSSRGVAPEKLADGLRQVLRHSYSRLAVFRRLLTCYRRLPAMLPLNLAFRRRAIPWATAGTR